jgi:DNA-binding GntR family transcriptional regulator
MKSERGNGSLPQLLVESSTLTHRALESMTAAIRNGHLAPGELYSVTMLAEEFGVSRTPVREALLVLEREGVVRFERNRGVRVLEITVQDLSAIFGLRLLLEVPAASHACRLIDQIGREALRDELAAMRQAASLGDESDFMYHDRNFHESILRAAGNERLTAMIGNLRDHVRRRGPSTVGQTRDLTSILAEHEAIMEAIEAQDPERTAVAMRDHISRTAELLIRQEGGTDSDVASALWAVVASLG